MPAPPLLPTDATAAPPALGTDAPAPPPTLSADDAEPDGACCCGPSGPCCLMVSSPTQSLSVELLFDAVTPAAGSATAAVVTNVPGRGDSGDTPFLQFKFQGSFTACGKTWCYAINLGFGAACGDWLGGAAGSGDRTAGSKVSLYVDAAFLSGECLFGYETPECGGLDVNPVTFAHSTPVDGGDCDGPVCATFGPFALDPMIGPGGGGGSCVGLSNTIACALGSVRVRVCYTGNPARALLPGAPAHDYGAFWGGDFIPTPVGSGACFCPRGYYCSAGVCTPAFNFADATFTTLAACRASGCGAVASYNCVDTAAPCADPGDGSGLYASEADCLAACLGVCPVEPCGDGTPGDGGGIVTPCCNRGEELPRSLSVSILAPFGGCPCLATSFGIAWSNAARIWIGKTVACSQFVTFAFWCANGTFSFRLWCNGVLIAARDGDFATTTGCLPLDVLWTPVGIAAGPCCDVAGDVQVYVFDPRA